MLLSRFARERFAHLPTALEPMPNLSKALGGPTLWVKRDDCTGLATGGNKTRKLEFLVGDALQQGADTLVTQGATQSNHVRQTAAAAVRYGMRCHALLERRVTNQPIAYEQSGNVLLDDLLGCSYEFRDDGIDMNAEAENAAQEMTNSGAKTYFIPGGGSNPIGALGYVDCALELMGQANSMGIRFDWIVHGTGSTGTQAGLVAGLHAIDAPSDVMGICVRIDGPAQEEKVFDLATRTVDHLGLDRALPRERVKANGDYVGDGYGQPTDSMVEALELAARTEGLILDPVYSGKAMAGLVGLIRQGVFKAGQNVCFLHTGGSAAVFGYGHLFAAHGWG